MGALLARLLDVEFWDWGSLPDYIVALTAAVSAVLVVRQLSGLGDDRRQAEATRQLQLDQFRSEAESARANLLLRIDEQFEGGGVFRSRARWLELRAQFRHEHAGLVPPAPSRDDFVQARMSDRLNELWDRVQAQAQSGDEFPAEVRDYNLVVRLPNWIETIGMLAREGMLPVGDVLKLYRSVIRTTMGVVAVHVEHRRSGGSTSSTAFENALWLHQEAATMP